MALWVKRLVKAFAADLGEKMAPLVLVLLSAEPGASGTGSSCVGEEEEEEAGEVLEAEAGAAEDAVACSGENVTVAVKP